MCGRFSLVGAKDKLKQDVKKIEVDESFFESFNIAPTQQALVITNEEPLHLQKMTWGLVPFWSKDGKPSGSMINARCEEITNKPAFRNAYQRRRCIIPADSFYEWRKEGKQKIPYRIHFKNDALLYMAGIWEIWGSGTDSLKTFSILTTTPNMEVSSLHNRMPVLLPDESAREHWLNDSTTENLDMLFHPIADGSLHLYRVSVKLNSPAYNGPDLHKEVPETLTLF